MQAAVLYEPRQRWVHEAYEALKEGGVARSVVQFYWGRAP